MIISQNLSKDFFITLFHVKLQLFALIYINRIFDFLLFFTNDTKSSNKYKKESINRNILFVKLDFILINNFIYILLNYI